MNLEMPCGVVIAATASDQQKRLYGRHRLTRNVFIAA
jgi:hypothetical protein